ncbi:MAG TPA: GIY-YIG nuclease family protein [Bacteroidota bacterium]|nr:GIY-YIG nuclease family protein [Bacteroidota bacterium]
MWYVYALRSLARNYIYVGLTSDLERRFKQHNDGKERTTRPYRPFRLILSEGFVTRAEARHREMYLKSGSGKEFLKKIDGRSKGV